MVQSQAKDNSKPAKQKKGKTSSFLNMTANVDFNPKINKPKSNSQDTYPIRSQAAAPVALTKLTPQFGSLEGRTGPAVSLPPSSHVDRQKRPGGGRK